MALWRILSQRGQLKHALDGSLFTLLAMSLSFSPGLNHLHVPSPKLHVDENCDPTNKMCRLDLSLLLTVAGDLRNNDGGSDIDGRIDVRFGQEEARLLIFKRRCDRGMNKGCVLSTRQRALRHSFIFFFLSFKLKN